MMIPIATLCLTASAAFGGDQACSAARADIAKADQAACSGKATACSEVRYVVDGKCVSCPVSFAKLVKKAIDDARLTYRFGEADACCNLMAEHLSKETGEPIMYSIGDRSTGCDIQASVLESFAKIRAGLGAMEQATAQATKKEAAS
jgi:hypothetical protein